MNRRSLLASMLLSPFARLIFRRVPSPPIQQHPALADSHKGGRLHEVRWDELSDAQQSILSRAVNSHEGCAGAVFPWDVLGDPRWILNAERLAACDSLFRLGLLTFTSKMPEHEGDLCGWYTISQYGREIVPSSVRCA